MAYTISGQAGVTSYGVMEFVVNTEDDVATVPTNCESGSTIFVIETGNVYMLSVNTKIWTPIGGSDDDSEEVEESEEE